MRMSIWAMAPTFRAHACRMTQPPKPPLRRAAGVTSMIPFILSAEPYTEVFDDIKSVTEEGARIDFGFHFVIATEAQLAEVPILCQRGAPTAKLFMNIRGDEGKRLGLPGTDDGFMFRLLETLSTHGGMLCPHPENIEVAWVLRDRVLAQDEADRESLEAWNATRPPFVEAEALSRAAYFGRITGTPVHGVHTSSGDALAAAVQQRTAGSDVSIETCIQYLTQDTDSDIGAMGKVNPPLRAPTDSGRPLGGDCCGSYRHHRHRSYSPSPRLQGWRYLGGATRVSGP